MHAVKKDGEKKGGIHIPVRPKHKTPCPSGAEYNPIVLLMHMPMYRT
jgi:hypothetical protein